jgi:hypothetical protein
LRQGVQSPLAGGHVSCFELFGTKQPEDTIRFYALRLHEARMIKSNPQQISSEGADWRFLQELKRELKR